MAPGHLSLNEETAKDLLHQQGRTRYDRLLVILALDDAAPKSVARIRELGLKCGVREIRKWNVSDALKKGNGSAILTDEGWEITTSGTQHVRTFLTAEGVVEASATNVRKHLAGVSSAFARGIIEDSIRCFELGLLRPAVVFSWVGAVAMLHEHVVAHKLAAFNAEAKRRDPKWRDAITTDDLGRMKEHEFLDVIESLSVIGKNLKQVLQNQCLNLRNACGHPSSLVISENNVAAHLDTLILNVYSKY